MIAIGVILIICGVLACVVGALQNTILFIIFADTGAQLARFHDEADFKLIWLFNGPGTITLIIGALVMAIGIFLIILNKKRAHLYVDEEYIDEEYINEEYINEEDITE